MGGTAVLFNVSAHAVPAWPCLLWCCMILDLSSCTGRCGEGFSRERACQCDYSCQRFKECCPDFGKLCAPALSCSGRCFEAFQRGRPCDCDADCERYGKCCDDYAEHCKEEEKNLCNGQPADSVVALQNGTLAVFRGHYYWLLNGRRPPTTEPRRISDGWGVPSPIDTVSSSARALRGCSCAHQIASASLIFDPKPPLFLHAQGALYWRFTNGLMDAGYPKPLARGFAGLSGKIVAALPVARHHNRPESVYFIKKGGKIQQYIYKQEAVKTCKNKPRVTIKYPAYVPTLVIRRRFQRAVRLQAFHTVRINSHPAGNLFLRKEVKITSYWRGLPKIIHSTLSVPNYNKPDGYDYYAFSNNRYYSLDVGSKTATSVTYLTGKTVTKDWYNCPK
uniref:SMB domain-containing protein n=1 Tax=Nothoprocta perdicaria TaxID=30464 RepID=A0A8C6YHK5_NOTPE